MPHAMLRPGLLKTGLTLFAVYIVLMAAALLSGAHYIEIWLPLYRWELSWLAPQFHTLELELIRPKQESLIAWTLETGSAQIIGGKVLPAGIKFDASTLLSHALQHPLIIYSVILAWPGFSMRQRLPMILLSLPLLMLVALLDVPLVLAGSIEDLILYNMNPSALSSSLIVNWMHFLNGGGRQVLSLAAGVVVVSIYRVFCSGKNKF